MKISIIFVPAMKLKTKTNIMKTFLKDFTLAVLFWISFISAALIILNLI